MRRKARNHAAKRLVHHSIRRLRGLLCSKFVTTRANNPISLLAVGACGPTEFRYDGPPPLPLRNIVFTTQVP